MEISTYNMFQFLVIGTAVGFLGGFLGVGGGIIMIPLLTFWAFPAMQVHPEVMVHLAFGTSLAIIIPTSLSGSLAHSRAGNVVWKVVGILALTGVIGSFVGSTLAATLKGAVLKTLFGIVLVITSAQMILQKKGAGEAGEVFVIPKPSPTLFVGFLVGIFSGFFGLGGGVIAIPLMVRFLSIPIHKAMGISIAFVFFAAIVGTAGYAYNGWGRADLPAHSFGYIHLSGWVLAGIPSIIMAQWGAKLSYKTRPVRLRRFFALLLMLVGIWMLF
jgi:uncharacterized protein